MRTFDPDLALELLLHVRNVTMMCMATMTLDNANICRQSMFDTHYQYCEQLRLLDFQYSYYIQRLLQQKESIRGTLMHRYQQKLQSIEKTFESNIQHDDSNITYKNSDNIQSASDINVAIDGYAMFDYAQRNSVDTLGSSLININSNLNDAYDTHQIGNYQNNDNDNDHENHIENTIERKKVVNKKNKNTNKHKSKNKNKNKNENGYRTLLTRHITDLGTTHIITIEFQNEKKMNGFNKDVNRNSSSCNSSTIGKNKDLTVKQTITNNCNNNNSKSKNTDENNHDNENKMIWDTKNECDKITQTEFNDCTYCGKVSLPKIYRPQSSNYRRILNINGGTQYQCLKCDKIFTKGTTANGHYIQYHTTRFQCSFNDCKKTFASSTAVKLHERIHTGDKPHLCTICNKSFARKNSLTSHIRIHTGEKPFQCKYCDKRFVQRSSCEKHERIHTGDKRFKCKICDARFVQKQNCEKHEKRHKNKEKRLKSKIGKGIAKRKRKAKDK